MVKRIKVKLIGTGAPNDNYRVNLPTYIMDGEPDYELGWAWVLVPDDEVDKDGRSISEKRIRKKYREGWADFKAASVKPPPPPPPPPPKPSMVEKIKRFLRRS